MLSAFGLRRCRKIAIDAVTLAELAPGPHATDDPTERASRQDRLQRVESTFDAIPFDLQQRECTAACMPRLRLSSRNPPAGYSSGEIRRIPGPRPLSESRISSAAALREVTPSLLNAEVR